LTTTLLGAGVTLVDGSRYEPIAYGAVAVIAAVQAKPGNGQAFIGGVGVKNRHRDAGVRWVFVVGCSTYSMIEVMK
jgi:hypothetical protein